MTDPNGNPNPDPNPAPGSPASPPAAALPDGFDWKTLAPDDVKSSPDLMKQLDSAKGLPDVIKGYAHGQKMIGGMVKLPGKDAKPEEVAAFREKLGVPKAATEYDTPALAEGQTWDPGAVDTFRGVFHRLGLTKDQASGLMTAYAEFERGRIDQAGQQYVEDLRGLAKQWGQPVFDRKAALAARAIEKFGPAGLKQWLDASKIGDHPLLFQAWAAIGEQFAEDGLIEGRVSTVPTEDEAKAKIAAIKADKTHPYNNINHPRHQDALEEVLSLQRLALGKEGTRPVLTIA